MLASFINPHEKYLQVWKTGEDITRIWKFNDIKKVVRHEIFRMFLSLYTPPPPQPLICSNTMNKEHIVQRRSCLGSTDGYTGLIGSLELLGVYKMEMMARTQQAERNRHDRNLLRSLIREAAVEEGFPVAEGKLDELPGCVHTTEKVSDQPEPSKEDFSPVLEWVAAWFLQGKSIWGGRKSKHLPLEGKVVCFSGGLLKSHQRD